MEEIGNFLWRQLFYFGHYFITRIKFHITAIKIFAQLRGLFTQRLRRLHHLGDNRLLDLGNKIMIGKGKRDAAVKEAVVRNGAVYLAALGGAGALMAKSVETLEVIAWPDLGCEAVRRLTVRDMPLTVILDAHGGDLYQSGPAAYLESEN